MAQREHRDRGLSKRDRIARLRTRLEAIDTLQSREIVAVIKGILDLLADEL